MNVLCSVSSFLFDGHSVGNRIDDRIYVCESIHDIVMITES